MTPLNPEWYDAAKNDFDRVYNECTDELFYRFNKLGDKHDLDDDQVREIIERRIGPDLADEWMNYCE